MEQVPAVYPFLSQDTVDAFADFFLQYLPELSLIHLGKPWTELDWGEQERLEELMTTIGAEIPVLGLARLKELSPELVSQASQVILDNLTPTEQAELAELGEGPADKARALELMELVAERVHGPGRATLSRYYNAMFTLGIEDLRTELDQRPTMVPRASAPERRSPAPPVLEPD